MKHHFFVAGTDTGVGKTFVSCALLEAANKAGLTSMALKPVAAGAEVFQGQLANEDAILLQQHMSLSLPYEQVNPVLLKAATSPHIAAREEGRNISVSRLEGICRGALMHRPEFALVEGAGGWRVPLNERELLSDLAQQLALPVILVVGLRLGCINHALLTAQAIHADGLRIAGWVANEMDVETMAYDQEYMASLCAGIRAPLLGRISYQANHDPSDCVADLNLDKLFGEAT